MLLWAKLRYVWITRRPNDRNIRASPCDVKGLPAYHTHLSCVRWSNVAHSSAGTHRLAEAGDYGFPRSRAAESEAAVDDRHDGGGL